ncbi:hypothetical protein COB28_04600 [Candidatus Dependentiae bacterium]|nr:MAG: hypothetical protein COB28_04600 [Candidatus Dependentiae bacterium]
MKKVLFYLLTFVAFKSNIINAASFDNQCITSSNTFTTFIRSVGLYLAYNLEDGYREDTFTIETTKPDNTKILFINLGIERTYNHSKFPPDIKSRILSNEFSKIIIKNCFFYRILLCLEDINFYRLNRLNRLNSLQLEYVDPSEAEIRTLKDRFDKVDMQLEILLRDSSNPQIRKSFFLRPVRETLKKLKSH